MPGLAWNALDVGANAQARGLGSIGDGIGKVAQGIGAYLANEASTDDFETKKKLLDFRLQTEMGLEEYKRNMPQGGDGFSAGWNAEYQRRAKEFVGDKDANIPKSMRQQVGLALKQHEVGLSERAQRYEWGEKDKATVEGLETTLGQMRSFVEADPSRKDEKHAEGRDIIMSAPISPAERYRLAKKYAIEIDKTAIVSRGMKINSAEDREALRRDLGPDMPDRRQTSILPEGGKVGKAAGWAARNPEWQKLDSHQKAALMALMEADGARPDDARNALGAMINRATKNGEELGAHVSQKIYQPTIEPAQEARIGQLMRRKEFAELTEWSRRRAAGQEPDPVNGATHFLAPEKTMLALEAGDPRKYRSWRSWTGFDGKEYRGVKLRDGSHAFLSPEGDAETKPMAESADGSKTSGESDWLDPGTEQKAAQSGVHYAGPYSNLTLPERKALWGQVETEWRKKIGTVEKVIKDQMSVAESGMLPPDAIKAELDKQVRAIGDPMLTAQYATMLRKAEATAYWQKAPPVAIEAAAQRMRAVMDGKATKEQLQAVEHMEKLAESTKDATSKDPMTWAHKVGVAVPLAVQPPDNLDPGQRARWQPPVEKVQLEAIGTFQRPDIDAVLQRRFAQAKGVALYNGKPVQAFTEIERKALNDSLKMGGNGMLHTMGTIARSAATQGIDPAMAMREFTKDAPEVAMIGELVANGGDGNMLTTAATAVAWRHGMGEKFQSTIDKARVKPELGEFAVVLGATPTKVDHVKALANLVYEYESRAKGRTEFEPEEYTKVVKRIMGETTDSRGNTYGGVGSQGTGWGIGLFGRGADGKAGSKVLVPAGVKQDGFDEMVDALRASDLIEAGGVPMANNGEPLTMAEIRRATWVSVGPGRYALKLKDDADGTGVYAKGDGDRPYVIDMRPILPRIKQRRPPIFAGYDSTMDATPAASADPALPTWWTGKPQPEIGAAP
ncbi:MAG: hypothetical protein IT533_10000 [Hyphomicrobiales bacterium]|nr:hypothetical protein [Hyphomicrobiales bacterium]